MDAAFRTGAYPAYTLDQLRAFIAAGNGSTNMRAEIARREAVLAGDMTRATPGERLRAIREAEAKPAPATPAMAWLVARTQAHLHVNGNYSGISVSLTKCRPDDALIASMNLPPLPKIGAR